jgi:16S rRNA (guanine966-N2)-methyltransferase
MFHIEQKFNVVRIISGRFKGHKLVSFEEGHIRPTTDRVKESVFNILSSVLDGARVLDLFSGTGNLGLEALSRGAHKVDMVEKSPRSIKIIMKNLDKLKVEDDEIKVHQSDALDFVKEYKGDPYDLILIDPPFPSKVCHEILNEIAMSPVASPSSWIVIEHSKQESLDSEIGTLRCVDTRRYGDKIASFYKKKEV